VNRPSEADASRLAWVKYADHLEAELTTAMKVTINYQKMLEEARAERYKLREQGLQLADDLDKCRSELAARILGDKP
jgi:hypothetical protein